MRKNKFEIAKISNFSVYQKDKIEEIFNLQKSAFLLNPLPDIDQRNIWLQDLKNLILKYKYDIAEAISIDFGNRSKDETLFAELIPSIDAINRAINNLKRWAKPSKRNVGIAFKPAKAKVEFQPLGVVGIIVPWNYPLFLAISPLVGALAAGNRVMLKISEFSENFGKLFNDLINKYFSKDLVSVVLGGIDVGIYFSKLTFDHLLFTGSTKVGKSIMSAASNNLTPVTLELGGKSPAIISSKANFRKSVQKIAFGKALNAGQTCVAPDYVFVPKDKIDKFIVYYTKAINKFFKKSSGNNQDYTSIVNDAQFNRLKLLIQDAKNKGATIKELLAQNDIDDTLERKLPHYLIFNATDKMKITSEEIFGPILLVYTYDNLFDVINFINSKPRPLALYFFSDDKQEQDYVISHTRSGGVCINDTINYVAIDDLPFGGIGNSGMGQYHGKEGFLTFSKARPIFIQSKFNSPKFIYPPYGRFSHKLIYKFFLR